MGYTKLFSDIVMSTVWREPDHVRLVWITMLACKDRHDIVSSSIPGLADAARVSIEQCEKALKRLSEPDPYSRSTEHEGRRIEPCDGGWHVLNGEKYRHKLSPDDEREKARIRKARQRERERDMSRSVTPCPASSRQEEAEEDKDKKDICRFDDFWEAYPRKEGDKPKALKYWKRDKLDTIADHIIAVVEYFKKSNPAWLPNAKGETFIPLPTTFINGKRWNDEIQPVKTGGRPIA